MQSAVVVPVPDVEPFVGPLRDRFDPAAALGVPVHVTVVYPFLPVDALTREVIEALTAVVTVEPAPTVTFARAGRFPGVLWLDPEPADVFVRLTHTCVARWPQAPPYGGAYGPDPTPHLTVAMTDDATADRLEARLAASLPVTTTLPEAVLIGFDGHRWSTRFCFAFG